MQAKQLCIYLLTISLIGCQASSGIYHSYPENWPKLLTATSSNCPDISGTYWNSGIFKYPSSCDSLYLNRKFSLNNLKGDESITINQLSDELIDISFSTEGSQSIQLASNSGEFICKDGAVWIDQGEYFAAEGVGMAKRKFIMGFKKATDGSLIGQYRNSGWGLVMWIVPIGGTQILWYKWDPYI